MATGARIDNDRQQGFVQWQDHQLYMGETTGSAYVSAGGHRNAITLAGSSGAWTSPIVRTRKEIHTINPSWQAYTPEGTFINIELRVRRRNLRWSNWYQMGQWGFSNTPHFTRTSYTNQPRLFGTIFTDTYVNTTDEPVGSYQLRVHLTARGKTSPRVFQTAAQVAVQSTFAGVSPTTMRKRVDLLVPAFAQYLHTGEYPALGGGEVWCNPASLAMVLKYFQTGPTAEDIAALPADSVFDARGRADGEVPFAAFHTYDEAYEGTGNWAFGSAYAAHYGIRSNVRVFTSLQRVEAEIRRKNPVIVSLDWNNKHTDPNIHLPGAGISRSKGHLLVVRGFEANGDVITNDPATHAGNDDVCRRYKREPFERRWIDGSNGAVLTFSR